MAKGKQDVRLKITQKDGVIDVIYNNCVEHRWDINKVFENNLTPVRLANMVAEIMADCLNQKRVIASVHDLNATLSYNGTYFEFLDYRADDMLAELEQEPDITDY